MKLVVNRAEMVQLVTNQAEMITLQTHGYEFPELVKLLANQANSFLLTINNDGAVRSFIVSCPTCKKDGHASDKCWFRDETKLRDAVNQLAETKMILKTEIKLRDAQIILKTKKTTAVEKRGLVDAKQNIYDAGPDLLRSAFIGTSSKAQKLLSESCAQSYINCTDADGRTSLFKTSSKGYAPLFIAAQMGTLLWWNSSSMPTLPSILRGRRTGRHHSYLRPSKDSLS
jgi:hypothetical protein